MFLCILQTIYLFTKLIHFKQIITILIGFHKAFKVTQLFFVETKLGIAFIRHILANIFRFENLTGVVSLLVNPTRGRGGTKRLFVFLSHSVLFIFHRRRLPDNISSILFIFIASAQMQLLFFMECIMNIVWRWGAQLCRSCFTKQVGINCVNYWLNTATLCSNMVVQ